MGGKPPTHSRRRGSLYPLKWPGVSVLVPQSKTGTGRRSCLAALSEYRSRLLNHISSVKLMHSFVCLSLGLRFNKTIRWIGSSLGICGHIDMFSVTLSVFEIVT